MRVKQKITLVLEGDDVAALRLLLSHLPDHARGPMVVTWPINQPPTDPEAVKRLAQRLMAVVNGGV